MNKFFQITGILTLICFSFFYTEKTANVIKEYDLIMKQIKQVALTKQKEAINAKIIDNKIIPGKKGYVVNINKSYYKMKQYGKYEESLLVYKDKLPTISYHDYLDKYVIKGNDEEKNVGLLFLIDDEDNIDDLITILKDNDTKGTFFLERKIVEDNQKIVIDILKTGNKIGSLDSSNNYETKNFSWMNVLIKKRQGFNYCYTKEENDEILKNCKINKNTTVLPNHYLEGQNTKKIKTNIENGDMIAIKVNDITKNILPSLINFIKGKGYQLKTLSDLIKE